MSNNKRTVYVNGDYVPEDEAKVSVFDRGFLFADAVYEVTSVIDGKFLDFDAHTARLERSLNELDMPMPMTRDELLDAHRQLIEMNNVQEGCVYIQVTRGVADRDFIFPEGIAQTVIMFTQAKKLTGEKKGLRVISTPDIRWGRRDIKTVQLLAASIGKTAAKKQGKDDTWLVKEGTVTEGSSNNTYIVTKDGKIVTRHLSNTILPGITRAAVLKLAAEQGLEIEERPFTIEEAKDATEAFMTAATSFVTPVIEIDGTQMSGGIPGPISLRLNEIYIEEGKKTSI
ncbi:D-amino-acid transaminase [Pseudodesulfovibrio sp. zrk46]|uniref:D-amino-acid transaminase n=1 Tax=Pseudodesulfovibrio sp. zrk46 TaxID=2725288 RepID=UPI001448B07B|nr:D-amino-acid transaminase [Pseudodesulfovibrio sp. zrk46]QJB57473.1 D-amino-acid transaminase [Pseudodesulfovibrio sp. zrk46]